LCGRSRRLLSRKFGNFYRWSVSRLEWDWGEYFASAYAPILTSMVSTADARSLLLWRSPKSESESDVSPECTAFGLIHDRSARGFFTLDFRGAGLVGLANVSF
jgi:hypothetical protein